MKSRKKVLFVFGTRPEAIKMAPLITEFKKSLHQFKPIIVNTGQHDQMLKKVLKAFNFKIKYDLKIMKKNQSLSKMLSKLIDRLEKVIIKEKPDLILVQGDTATAFAAALLAFYHKCALGHIEAGLRTFDKWKPFPEEINRQLITRVADLHFAPTKTALNHLLKEHIPRSQIYVTGNTVIDALFGIVGKQKINSNKKGKKIILVTVHRRESFGLPLDQITSAIKKIALQFNDEIEIIIPMHKNPKVRKVLISKLSRINNILLCEPQGYREFAKLIEKAYIILTDSGGIQEEAPSLGKPVLVLREKTERPEAIQAKTVKLVGFNRDNIYHNVMSLMKNPKEYNKMAKAINPYGDGQASKRIIQIIKKHFKFSNKLPKEFKV